MISIRRLSLFGAALLLATTRLAAQVVERPVPFDNAGAVMVMTPYIAQRADLRAPWWPVSGDFTEARLYSITDSSYVLTVGRRNGQIERYSLSAADRDAIRAIVSRLPRDVIAARVNARNSFVRNQTLLGLTVYGPAFAGAIADDDAGQVAGYLVVAGGSFFAASEISRRMLVSRPQSDLAFNMGHNGALAGLATMYLFNAHSRAQSAGAFVGGLVGTGLGLSLARGWTEADAVGAGFGSDLGALIGAGVTSAFRGGKACEPSFGIERCNVNKAQAAIVLGSGIVGYPLGLLYPRNARYRVTAGDINTLWAGAVVGILAGAALLPESPKRTGVATALTSGGLLGVMLADRFLVQRADHGRTEATQLLFGTLAGGLMGGGVGALVTRNSNNPEPVFALAAVGGLAGLIGSEYYLDPAPDAGPQRFRVTFNPAGFALAAARTPGTHALINVRF